MLNIFLRIPQLNKAIFGGSEGKNDNKTLSIVRPTFDFYLFIFSAGLPIIFFVLYLSTDISISTLTLMFMLTLDSPHAMQTITRVGMDKQGRDRFGLTALKAFILIGFVCGFVILAGYSFYLLIVIFYYGPFHIMMQHFGIASLYRARASNNSSKTAQLDKGLLLSTYALCLAWATPSLFNRGPLWEWPEFIQPFEDATLMHIPPIIGIAWEYILVPTATLIFTVILIAWCYHFYQDLCFKKYQNFFIINKPRLAVLWLAVLNYLIVFFFLNSQATSMAEGIFYMTIGITAWHTVQYHGLVWHYNHTKFKYTPHQAADEAGGSPWLAWLSQKQHTYYYMIFIAVLTLCAQGITLGLIWLDQHWGKDLVGQTLGLGYLAFAVTFSHYFLDGRIWKIKHNPEAGLLLRQ